MEQNLAFLHYCARVGLHHSNGSKSAALNYACAKYQAKFDQQMQADELQYLKHAIEELSDQDVVRSHLQLVG